MSRTAGRSERPPRRPAGSGGAAIGGAVFGRGHPVAGGGVAAVRLDGPDHLPERRDGGADRGRAARRARGGDREGGAAATAAGSRPGAVGNHVRRGVHPGKVGRRRLLRLHRAGIGSPRTRTGRRFRQGDRGRAADGEPAGDATESVRGRTRRSGQTSAACEPALLRIDAREPLRDPLPRRVRSHDPGAALRQLRPRTAGAGAGGRHDRDAGADGHGDRTLRRMGRRVRRDGAGAGRYARRRAATGSPRR